jgi:hypothetical protein
MSSHSVAALLAVLLVMISVPVTLRMLYQSYVVGADASVLEVVDFLNDQTPSDSLIETYDPELFFLLKRRYHYPPDQIHIDLIRRAYLAQEVSIDYNPLAADPDYLVVGPQSKVWRLYDPFLSTGEFRLLKTFRRYNVYERVHSKEE